MEEIKIRIGVIIFIFWIFYSFWYVLRKDYFKSLILINKKTIIETYKYSLKLLTIIFLIVFNLEYSINLFIFKGFAISNIFERNPSNLFELIIFLVSIIFVVGSIIWWVYKIHKSVGDNLMKIQYDNEAVAITMRFISLVVFLIFNGFILIPMFTYGLAGNIGNPRI